MVCTTPGLDFFINDIQIRFKFLRLRIRSHQNSLNSLIERLYSRRVEVVKLQVCFDRFLMSFEQEIEQIMSGSRFCAIGTHPYFHRRTSTVNKKNTTYLIKECIVSLSGLPATKGVGMKKTSSGLTPAWEGLTVSGEGLVFN